MNHKKLAAIFLSAVMICLQISPSFATANSLHTLEATRLQAIGLMAGGAADQNLDQQMTRMQGLIFAIKAAGRAADADLITEEQVGTALAGYTDASDVPTYGRKFMAYAILNNITSGIGNKKLGAMNPISGTSFLVFLLKSGMGYSNANTANIMDLAFGANVITNEQKQVYGAKQVLVRDDAAVILYKAVMDGINDDGGKFIDSLIDCGFVSQAAFKGISDIGENGTGQASGNNLSIEEIAKKQDYVVLLASFDESGEVAGFGSGFVISTDGKIVTNYHVVDRASAMTATLPDGRTFHVSSILAYDTIKDLAILKADGLNPGGFLALGDSSAVAIGQQVVAIGNPEGLQNTVSAGIVSSIRFNEDRGANDLQITAPLSPGSSGGPLFNMKGEVIGINYGVFTEGQNLNFSIPVLDLKPLLSNIAPKTFSEVLGEVYPSLAELSSYLFDRYGIINIEGNEISLDYFESQFPYSDNKMIYHYINISDPESLVNYYNVLKDPDLTREFYDVMLSAMKDVAVKYPDAEQLGGISVSFSVEEPPMFFDTKTFNPSTGLWEVKDINFFFVRKADGSYSYLANYNSIEYDTVIEEFGP